MYNFTLFGGKVKSAKSFLNVFKSITGFGVVMLFLFNTSAIQAQIIDNETAIVADFGIDGDAYDSVMEFGPIWIGYISQGGTVPDPTQGDIDGSDDWFATDPFPDTNCCIPVTYRRQRHYQLTR